MSKTGTVVSVHIIDSTDALREALKAAVVGVFALHGFGIIEIESRECGVEFLLVPENSKTGVIRHVRERES